jgi:hypothetical protein
VYFALDTPDDQMSSGAFKFLEYSGNFDFFSHESKMAPSHTNHPKPMLQIKSYWKMSKDNIARRYKYYYRK